MAPPTVRFAVKLRASVLALTALVLGSACWGGAHAPEGPPNAMLNLGSEPDPKGPSGPFAVVFGAPSGETEDAPEISLVFNRPMVPLELAGNEKPAPVKLTPAVPGRWQWVGTSALTFVPETHLPRATEFVVEVPKGTKDLAGDSLDRTFTLKFSTARPRVVRFDASEDTDHLSPESTFTLWTNQPVEVADLARATALTLGAEHAPFPVEIKQRDADNPQVFTVTPAKKLPLGTEMELAVSEQLRGKEGPLTAASPASYRASTYGPFSVTDIHCYGNAPGGKCSFEGDFQIDTTNEVTLAQIKKAVRIEPRLDLRFSSWMSDEDSSYRHYIRADFKPGKRYTITVSGAGLKDVYGQPLTADYRKTLEIGDVWPSAELGVAGTYIEPGSTVEIPAYVVNARDAELAYAPLTKADVVTLEARRFTGRGAYERILARPKAQARPIGPASAVNAVARHAVKVDDVLGKGGRGAIEVGVRYTSQPGTRYARIAEETRVVHVTDLAISGKVSPEGSILWITRLSTGAPVSGANVTIRWQDGELPGQHITDKDGLVRIPKSEFVPQSPYQEESVILVDEGTDWSYRPVRDVLDGWRYGASFSFSEESPFGLVFTDAGIYRPGDAVRIKGILRDPQPRGLGTPAGKKLKLRVESSDGNTIAEEDHTLSSFGTFDAKVTVPATGRLGTYHISAQLDDSTLSTDAYTTFEVAEYRPTELKASAETDKPSYVRGDPVTCTVRGDYLYGAPMSKAESRVSLSRRPSGFWPPGLEDFSVSDEAYTFDLPSSTPPESVLQSATGTLDQKGLTTLKTTLSMPAQTGAEAIVCEAEITDISRQVIGTSTTAIVHPAEHYVALDPGEDIFVSKEDGVTPKVLAVNPKGDKLTGKKVKLELIRRIWTVARQKTAGGELHRVSTPVDSVVATCDVVTGSAPASCNLKPTQPGYHLIRATSQDARKNPVAASAGVYVSGDSTSGWRDTDENRLDLVPDKKAYAVGQTAKILVKSPFPSAEALITVERSGVYTVSRQSLKGTMPTLSIPITADLRPNAFVTVLLVRGRSKAPPKTPKGADVGAPTFRFGAAQLTIDPEARRLAVSITPDSTDKRPGQDLSVTATVKDHQGKPARAEVTLYAVDEGVLSLIGYETPDPILTMNQPRPLRVATLETREDLARTFNPFAALGLDKGKDGGDGADSTGTSFRKDFRTSAYFHPTLVTDDQGRIQTRFKLPDSLTTYRVMAVVAADDDRFGYAQSFVTTSRPLMARPALPRFLRAGDSIDAGVIVTSKGLAKSTIDVELTAEGVVTKGPTKKTVDLDPGQSVEVRFLMDAPRTGNARLRFVTKGGGEEDRVEVTRKIQPPLTLEAVALYGDTTSTSVEALGDMSAMRDDVGGLSISTASTALIGLDAGVEQLIEYPYGCTEQLTSRLVPLLPLRDLARDYGFPLPKNIDAVVTDAVAKILSHQKPDGGFGLWAESESSSPWFTAYALWGLTHAEKRGVPVPKDAVDGAVRYLQGSIEEVADIPWMRASVPFILDVLAERGKPDVGRMNAWFEDRKTLPLFAQAQLLHALAISKGDAKAISTLSTELESGLRLDGPVARVVSNHGDAYAVILDSDARSSALVLRGLVAARPDHPMAIRLVQGLLADRHGGTWRSTQETAWALLAIDDYRRQQEKKSPDFIAHIFLGDTELGSHRFQGRSLDQASTTVSPADVVAAAGKSLGFRVDGEGRLFYQARLRYSKKELPTKPLERGFYVEKTLRPVKPEELKDAVSAALKSGATSFTAGDLVIGEITVVTTSPRNYVVVDDPLPAGFEAIDTRLATTAPSLAGAEEGDDSPDDEDDIAMGRAYFSSYYIREVRDDRVLFFIDDMSAGMYRYRYLARATTHGTFVLPPARAEEMYAPEVFGRTAGATITVAPK
ncbi:MAG: MG2 domain-containing protein [Polyangiaceae bacterium]